MAYNYELRINGIQRRSQTMAFRPNVIAKAVEDIQVVGKVESIEIKVTKKKK